MFLVLTTSMEYKLYEKEVTSVATTASLAAAMEVAMGFMAERPVEAYKPYRVEVVDLAEEKLLVATVAIGSSTYDLRPVDADAGLRLKCLGYEVGTEYTGTLATATA